MGNAELTRARQAVRPPQAVGGDTGDDDTLGEARELADRFLRASDEAIERALSRDSREFVSACRQTNGQ